MVRVPSNNYVTTMWWRQNPVCPVTIANGEPARKFCRTNVDLQNPRSPLLQTHSRLSSKKDHWRPPNDSHILLNPFTHIIHPVLEEHGCAYACDTINFHFSGWFSPSRNWFPDTGRTLKTASQQSWLTTSRLGLHFGYALDTHVPFLHLLHP